MKSLKKTGGVLIGLAALLVACGSQVVEFPVDETAPPNKVEAPPDPGDDAGEEPCTDCQDPPPEPEDDAGPTPEEDAGDPDSGTPDSGTPEDDGGNGGPDAGEDGGQPPPDAGPPPSSCDDRNQSCGAQYGCCVSACAKSCHRDAVKTKKQCGAYQACFKVCQFKCAVAKKVCECKSKEDACKDKCDSDEKKCLSRATCDDDRKKCKYEAECCKDRCSDKKQ